MRKGVKKEYKYCFISLNRYVGSNSKYSNIDKKDIQMIIQQLII
jgi:hypothetical protein